MPVEEREGVMLVGFCPTCSEVRVKSRQMISKPEDCKPENFAGVNGAPDPSGDIPLCHECSAVLKFAKEELLQPKGPRPVVERAGDIREAESRPLVLLETLFEPGPDERMVDVKDLRVGEVLVVTTKRIVRLRF